MLELGKNSQILVLQPFATSSRTHSLIYEIKDDPQQTSPTLACIPWHISNKYYEADVYFKLSTLTFFDSGRVGKVNKAIRNRRTAKMKSSEEMEAAPIPKSDDDEELKRKVRNVFEALERPGGMSISGEASSSFDEEKMTELREEVDGVDAVMMVVDSNLSLRQHERLLAMLNSGNGENVVLSGFDLAVSIIVALPSPLEEGTAAGPSPPTMDQLNTLYTGKGWEFVDLDKEATLRDSSSDDEEGSYEALGEEELQGVARIREALQTHTWPTLVRKDDRFASTQGGTVIEEDSKTLSSMQPLRQEISSLPLSLDAMDISAIGAEPSKQDEELAKAFLKRIQASQEVSDSPIEASQLSSRSMISLQKELEKFLEDEDGEWPVSSKGQAREVVEDEAWPISIADTGTEAAFEDDFTEFVQGSEATIGSEFANQDAVETSLFLDNVSNDLDDAILMDTLEKEMAKGTSGGSFDKNYDFESTLSAVMAQAERVRSIKDNDERREEAARIALSISDMLS